MEPLLAMQERHQQEHIQLLQTVLTMLQIMPVLMLMFQAVAVE